MARVCDDDMQRTEAVGWHQKNGTIPAVLQMRGRSQVPVPGYDCQCSASGRRPPVLLQRRSGWRTRVVCRTACARGEGDPAHPLGVAVLVAEAAPLFGALRAYQEPHYLHPPSARRDKKGRLPVLRKAVKGCEQAAALVKNDLRVLTSSRQENLSAC